MANLTESPVYETGIFQLEKTTPVLGGAPVIDSGIPRDGFANVPLQQLANRTAWLKESSENFDLKSVGFVLNFTELREYSGTKTLLYVTSSNIFGFFKKRAFTVGDVDDGGVNLVSSDGLWTFTRVCSLQNIWVEWFGAVGDDVSDATDGFLKACLYLKNTNKPGRLNIGPGKFRFSTPSSQNFRLYGNIEVVGAGMGITFLIKDKDNNSAASLIHTNSVDVKTDNILISDLSLEDRWGSTDFTEITNNTLWLHNCTNVRILRVMVTGSGAGSFYIENCDNVSVSQCSFNRGKRDGVRIINAVNSSVVNNYFEKILDDAIACHLKDVSSVVSSYSYISGNTLVDSQGITALGNKTTIIDGNTLVRCMTRGIRVGSDVTVGEGNTAYLSTTITNNTIIDLFNGSVFGWANLAEAISFDFARATSKDIVEMSTNGVVVKPYDYLYIKGTNIGSVPNAGSYAFTVSGNKVVRTLKPTALYTDYGFGQRLTPTGFTNPAITLADMCLYALKTTGIFRDTIIEGNTFSGANIGWYLFAGTGVTFPQIRNMKCANNIFSNLQTRGVLLNGNGLVEFSDCTFDIDPFLESPTRNADGSWASGSTVVGVARQNSTIQAFFADCTFKNMATIADDNSAHRFTASKIHVDPVLVGGVTTWRGMNPGANARAIDAVNVVVEECDPNSSNFRSIKNICLKSAAGIPTTGTYIAAYFLENHAPNSTTRGWKRITTSNSHVLGTDWLAV